MSPVSIAALRRSLTSRVASEIHESQITQRYPKAVSAARHVTLRRVLHESETFAKAECCAATSPSCTSCESCTYATLSTALSKLYTFILLTKVGLKKLPKIRIVITQNSYFPETRDWDDIRCFVSTSYFTLDRLERPIAMSLGESFIVEIIIKNRCDIRVVFFCLVKSRALAHLFLLRCSPARNPSSWRDQSLQFWSCYCRLRKCSARPGHGGHSRLIRCTSSRLQPDDQHFKKFKIHKMHTYKVSFSSTI